jgi:hypothetical protein
MFTSTNNFAAKEQTMAKFSTGVVDQVVAVAA